MTQRQAESENEKDRIIELVEQAEALIGRTLSDFSHGQHPIVSESEREK